MSDAILLLRIKVKCKNDKVSLIFCLLYGRYSVRKWRAPRKQSRRYVRKIHSRHRPALYCRIAKLPPRSDCPFDFSRLFLLQYVRGSRVRHKKQSNWTQQMFLWRKFFYFTINQSINGKPPIPNVGQLFLMFLNHLAFLQPTSLTQY